MLATQPSSPLADCRMSTGFTQESFAEKVRVVDTNQRPAPARLVDLGIPLIV